MAYGTTQSAPMHHADTGFHIVSWVLSMLGVAAAAIGAWIMLAPDDGTLTVNGRTWAASDLTDTWGPWLLIVGGVVAAIGMAASAVRDWQHDANRWLTAAEVVLSLVGIGAAIAGIIILV